MTSPGVPRTVCAKWAGVTLKYGGGRESKRGGTNNKIWSKQKIKLKEDKYILKKVNNKMLTIKLSSADDTNKNCLKKSPL